MSVRLPLLRTRGCAMRCFSPNHVKLDCFVAIFLLRAAGRTGMAVFDTMRHIRPDVSTVCVGLAASMGAFLLASGHKVCLPNFLRE